jgi:hypothetical protein
VIRRTETGEVPFRQGRNPRSWDLQLTRSLRPRGIQRTVKQAREKSGDAGVAVCWMFTRCGKTGKGLGRMEALDTPPLPCFLQEYDSMGVRWWESAKDVILKGIVACGEWR